MRVKRVAGVMLALMSGAAAAAQENGSHPDLTARAANFMNGRVVADRQEKLQRSVCEKTGCLFIVNRSKGHDIVELRFDTVAPGAEHEPVWSNNALQGRIQPQRSAGIMKFGDDSLCTLPVRVLLEDRADKSRAELRGVMSLCKAPGVDVFSVKPEE